MPITFAQATALLCTHPPHRAILGNLAIPKRDTSSMSFDVEEEGTPCEYCGQPIGFMDDDLAVCPTCRGEYINMDFEGGDLESDNPLEF